MTNPEDQIARGKAIATIAETFLKSLGPDFRLELAFPELTEDMIARLRSYGTEESFPADATLYTLGDRMTDMFVDLEGEIDIILPSAESQPNIYARHRKNNFTGEFNLLNSQGALDNTLTPTPTTLPLIPR